MAPQAKYGATANFAGPTPRRTPATPITRFHGETLRTELGQRLHDAGPLDDSDLLSQKLWLAHGSLDDALRADDELGLQQACAEVERLLPALRGITSGAG